jgi:alkylation response protein AidB-like acyl-CoA dehydrogenase
MTDIRIATAPTKSQPVQHQPTQRTVADYDELSREASALARALASQIENERRLPDELVDRLRGGGLLLGGAPSEVGAPELAPAVALRCAEEIARGDASAGWCVSIAVTSSLLTAYLPAASRDELFGDGHTVAAGVWAPRGQARPVDGGYLVSGQWAFCSGIPHADVMFAGCFITPDSDADAGGKRPTPSVVALRKQELRVLDTWHTLGLRGTGSHDVVADEVFVPSDRVFSLFDPPVLDRPLYRFPVFGFFALSIAAAALGNARAAVEDLIDLGAGKKTMGSSRTLAERPQTQAAVAAGEASLRAARALYYDAIDKAWLAAQRDDQPVSTELRAGLRLAATNAARTSADVVRSMYDLAGGTAIYDDSPLQRRFRDAYTATAHFQVNEASREVPGRMLLGLPTDSAQL